MAYILTKTFFRAASLPNFAYWILRGQFLITGQQASSQSVPGLSSINKVTSGTNLLSRFGCSRFVLSLLGTVQPTQSTIHTHSQTRVMDFTLETMARFEHLVVHYRILLEADNEGR
ncbi:hypothetical protein [Pseudomonas viridiflava]|uniref:hypothetical protein n=1 Tax=Pseudomonas viridiflava TaxID=33069 RepID=UPI0013DCB79E|nr:hypothetical protein [Pseudomonas viridiflava]MEE4148858.1 hypothetical protein [Pseudomonas viridiflava]